MGSTGIGGMGNKQITGCILLIVLFALTMSCTRDRLTGVEETGGSSAGATKAWTFMLYDDADFQGAYDPFDRFCEEAFSGRHLNVVVLQDSVTGPGRLWYVNAYHEPILLDEGGEINMGSHETLYNLLKYSKENYPAERYVIAFYDHGGAWRGACWDKTSNDDNLSMDEMQRALSDAGGVDVVLFSAPCLMGAVESVYELRECTKVYVGSEYLSGYCWWVSTMGDICEALNRNPWIDSEDLGELIITSLWTHRDSFCTWGENITMSAIRTDAVDELTDAINRLSVEYLADFTRFRYHMQLVSHNMEIIQYEHRDLRDLVTWLRGITSKPSIRTALDDIGTYMDDAIILECHGVGHRRSSGLNIYFPDEGRVAYDSTYGDAETGLDFARDTHWDELLSAYFAGIDMVGEAPPVPPLTDGFTP